VKRFRFVLSACQLLDMFVRKILNLQIFNKSCNKPPINMDWLDRRDVISLDLDVGQFRVWAVNAVK
jgi:hypothetical protein